MEFIDCGRVSLSRVRAGGYALLKQVKLFQADLSTSIILRAQQVKMPHQPGEKPQLPIRQTFPVSSPNIPGIKYDMELTSSRRPTDSSTKERDFVILTFSS